MNDELLVDLARHGDRRALDRLLGSLAGWIYNVVRRFLLNPQESEDACQEVLVKISTHLSAYDSSRAAFRTWAYRIAVNHAMNLKRGAMESAVTGFDAYAKGLADTPDFEIPASEMDNPENLLLIEETKASCTLGMLLCLDREQRMAIILSDFMGVSDRVSAELLDLSHDAYRQRLSRARRDLYQFMDDRCGLIRTENPCRCSRKMRSFAANGWIDAGSPRFSAPHLARLKARVSELNCEYTDFQRPEYQDVFRDHPHFDSPARILQEIMQRFSPDAG